MTEMCFGFNGTSNLTVCCSNNYKLHVHYDVIAQASWKWRDMLTDIRQSHENSHVDLFLLDDDPVTVKHAIEVIYTGKCEDADIPTMKAFGKKYGIQCVKAFAKTAKKIQQYENEIRRLNEDMQELIVLSGRRIASYDGTESISYRKSKLINEIKKFQFLFD